MNNLDTHTDNQAGNKRMTDMLLSIIREGRMLPRFRHTFDVFGDCPCTDILLVSGLKERVVADGKIIFAQSAIMQSLVSAMSKSLYTDVNSLEIPAAVKDKVRELRIMDENLNKKFFTNIKSGKKHGEYLLLDFSAELFDWWFIEGTFVDASVSCVIDTFLREKNATLVSKLDYIKEHEVEMSRYVWEFCNFCATHWKSNKIILNKIHYITESIQQENNKSPLNEWQLSVYARTNEILDWYYERIERYMPEIHIIQMPPNMKIDEKHPWGVMGVHYEIGFYENLYSQLCVKMIQDEIAELKEHCDSHEELLVRKQEELVHHAEKLTLLESEVAMLRDSLERRNLECAVLSQKEQELIDENANLHEKVSKFQEESKELDSRRCAVETTLAQRKEELASLRKSHQQTLAANTALETGLNKKHWQLFNAQQRVARYHKMSKDPLITLYRKIRRTLGTWHHT
jgi:hypothetical protein